MKFKRIENHQTRITFTFDISDKELVKAVGSAEMLARINFLLGVGG